MKPLERVRFGECELDGSCRQLLRKGASVHLSRKAFDLLALLIERRPQAVTKAELFRHLWPDTVVVEANLSNLIAEIRAATGDQPKKPHLIRTVHRYGYAFVAEVVETPGAVSAQARDTLSWVLFDDVKRQLTEGDHLIGRHPGSIVPIADDTVSRHHAVIHVRGEEAVVEDLGSRNGTAVNGKRIVGTCALQDGDRLTVGAVTLIYRLASLGSSTVDAEHEAAAKALAPPGAQRRRIMGNELAVARPSPASGPGRGRGSARKQP